MYRVKIMGVELPPVPDEIAESLYTEFLKRDMQQNIELQPIESDIEYRNIIRKDSSHYVLIPKQWINKIGEIKGVKLERVGDTIILTPL